MKVIITGLFVALGVTAIAASAAPAPQLTKWQQQQQEKFKNSAPADEYFGRMKMSYLGMNNTFRDAAISSGDHTLDPGIVHKVELAEDALQAWGKKYPRDPQLARTYFLATQVDRKIWIKNNQELAWKYMNRVVQLFPDTFFGKTLKADLAKGFTQHYYALPVPCTTPVPSAPPDPNTATTPAAQFDTPAPEAAPTIEPTPKVTQAAKNLRIEVIPQPCVAPPTPPPSALAPAGAPGAEIPSSAPDAATLPDAAPPSPAAR